MGSNHPFQYNLLRPKGRLDEVMPSPFDPLIDIIHSRTMDSWKERNTEALSALFGSRYSKRAENSIKVRAPEMKGGTEAGVPYAAYIHPSNADAGAYGGMSFVIFPVKDAPCLVAMVMGTQGLAPDEAILGRPKVDPCVETALVEILSPWPMLM